MDGIAFGRYRLLERLGSGGMGEVFTAFDTATHRRVAIKVLPPDLADNAEFRERFRREAHAVAGLAEPHIVPIHDFGEIDGRLYLTMQLVEGSDVESLLRQQARLDPPAAVAIIEQAASALDSAHAAGVVHRDVKPSNLLVGARGFVYLIDFGIARTLGETGLTSHGAAIGTFAYMAPERFGTATVDGRADTYALACVLYQMLTGTNPFARETVEQEIAAHLMDEPAPPSTLVASLPQQIDAVLAQGLAKQPSNRFASAGEFAGAARAALASGADSYRRAATVVNPASASAGPVVDGPVLGSAAPIPAPAVPDPETVVSSPSAVSARGRRVLTGVAALTITVVAVVVAVVALRSTDHSDAAQQPVEQLPSLLATIPAGRGPQAVALDPTNHLLFSANHNSNTVSVIDLTTRAGIAQIPTGHGPRALAFDAVSQTLYAGNEYDDTVTVIDTATRVVTATVPVGRSPNHLAVDAASRTLCVTNWNDGTLSIIDTATRSTRAVVRIGKAASGVAIDPVKMFAYVANGGEPGITVVDLRANVPTSTIRGSGSALDLEIDQPRSTLYVTDSLNASVGVVSLAATGPPDGTLERIDARRNTFDVALDAPDGLLYASDTFDNTVTVIRLGDSSVLTAVPVGKGPAGLAVDPITHLVYVGNSGENTLSIIRPK